MDMQEQIEQKLQELTGMLGSLNLDKESMQEIRQMFAESVIGQMTKATGKDYTCFLKQAIEKNTPLVYNESARVGNKEQDEFMIGLLNKILFFGVQK